MGRPLIPLSINAEDQAQLVAWTKRPKTAQALAMRSRIVLLATAITRACTGFDVCSPLFWPFLGAFGGGSWHKRSLRCHRSFFNSPDLGKDHCADRQRSDTKTIWSPLSISEAGPILALLR